MGIQGIGAHFGAEILETQLDETIAAAITLGLPTIACPGFWGVDYQDPGTFQGFAALFNRVGAGCKTAGIQFLYHIHGHEFVDLGGKTGMDILFAETDPELVAYQPDTFWVQKAGLDPAEFIRRHAARIRQLHLKDSKNDTWTDTEIGSGIVKIRETIQAAKNAPVEWFIVEQEAFEMPIYESISTSLKNLRSMVV